MIEDLEKNKICEKGCNLLVQANTKNLSMLFLSIKINYQIITISEMKDVNICRRESGQIFNISALVKVLKYRF